MALQNFLNVDTPKAKLLDCPCTSSHSNIVLAVPADKAFNSEILE